MQVANSPVAKGFTVGICASDTAARLPSLISFLKSEPYGQGFELQKLVVVASGCPPTTLAGAKQALGEDERFELFVEPERRGKAEAINRIMGASKGDYLVMLNADAYPESGSIGSMLSMMDEGKKVGSVSACPTFPENRGMLGRSLKLMWSAYSALSFNLNHQGISNHACDELLAVRRSLVRSLPENVINDGAYIGAVVRAKGYNVRFSNSARVNIEVPSRVVDLVRQRRRILFGHIQVWKKLGRAPKTVESMLFMDPMVSFRTVIKLVSRSPGLIVALPIAAAMELISASLAAFDTVRSTRMHEVWGRIHI